MLVLCNIIDSLILSLLDTIQFVLFKLIVSLLSENHIYRCFKVLFISVSSSTTLFAWKVIVVSSENSTKLPRDLIFNISS